MFGIQTHGGVNNVVKEQAHAAAHRCVQLPGALNKLEARTGLHKPRRMRLRSNTRGRHWVCMQPHAAGRGGACSAPGMQRACSRRPHAAHPAQHAAGTPPHTPPTPTHTTHTVPPAVRPQVRFARSHQYVQAGTGPNDNRQLFFSRAPAAATEADVIALFSR